MTVVVFLTSDVVEGTGGGVIKERNVKLTKLELELMNVFWEIGAASVREIQEQLPEHKRPAYTTVQTIVYRLEEKGALRRTKKIGNAHIFEPLVSRKSVYRRVIDDMLELLGGSAQPLMSHLVESGKLTLEDVRAMESALIEVSNRQQPADSKPSRRERTKS